MIATSGIRDEKKNEYKEEWSLLREIDQSPSSNHLESLQFLFNSEGLMMICTGFDDVC